MSDLTGFIKDELWLHGADLVGVGSLAELPADVRAGLPIGIAIAVKFPKEVIRGMPDLPTRAYYDHYLHLDEKLDMLASLGAECLRSFGHRAIPLTRAYVAAHATPEGSLLPHKTVATRARLGWIGKSALLVTTPFGSMVRLTSILTDAPLRTAKPISESRCGDCQICRDACPAEAIVGNPWAAGTAREELVDVAACQETAQERSNRAFGIPTSICGKCIEICPYTSRYLDKH